MKKSRWFKLWQGKKTLAQLRKQRQATQLRRDLDSLKSRPHLNADDKQTIRLGEFALLCGRLAD